METQQNPTPDNLFQKLKHLINETYMPAANLADASLTLTTYEIFDKLQKVFPSDIYTAQEVALFMEEAGFSVIDKGGMKIEWLLKKRAK